MKQSGEGKAGDLAIIFDNKKNKFLAIGLYDPFSPIRVKILQANKSVNINEAFFAEKIKTAFAKRQPLLETNTNSYRLIYGENDGLPSLIADVYADVLVVKLYALIWLPFLDILFPMLMEISNCKTLVLRLSRNVQEQKALLGDLHDGKVILGTLKNENVTFREHGLLFRANVIHGHKTGYFLDHRHNRKKVGELAQSKRVLDVFSYAGGFSVHALAGRAKSVTSLDISKQALAVAKENAALNPHSGEHKMIAADAFDALQKLRDSHQKFDLIIIDPPSFAKKATEKERALKSYSRLAKLGTQLIAKDGILVLCSCSSRITRAEFFDTVLGELERSKKGFHILEKTYHDVDHPIAFDEGSYLKSIYIQVD